MSLQNSIINFFGVKPHINANDEIICIVNFLKNYLRKFSTLKTLVLGISGGQDSTLTGKLCQIAVSELRNERKDNNLNFIAVRMPYGIQSDEIDCQKAIFFIKPDKLLTINIKDVVTASERNLSKAGIKISDFVKGNEKARERMKIQYSIAGMTNGIVVGTSHAAEAITGFYTKYGDGGTDINPIFHLNKRQGRELLFKLKCPSCLYNKVPTADLEDDHPCIPDEIALGLKYDHIDDYLEGKKINVSVAKKIESLFLKTEHKRHLPITILNSYLK